MAKLDINEFTSLFLDAVKMEFIITLKIARSLLLATKGQGETC